MITVNNIRDGELTMKDFKSNGYKFQDEQGWNIYAGRGLGSPLGNQYKIDKNSDRAQVIQKFRKKLWDDLQLAELGKVTPLISEIRELAVLSKTFDIHLFCWCFPKPCHCDVIKRCIEWMNEIQF